MGYFIKPCYRGGLKKNLYIGSFTKSLVASYIHAHISVFFPTDVEVLH